LVMNEYLFAKIIIKTTRIFFLK